MINFVERKEPDFDFVRNVLDTSRESNHWTNFGPVSRQLEREIESLLELPADLSVVACASGTSALFALAGLHSFLAGRPLRWIVSAFTFACQRQGPLANSIVVDCSEDGFLDLQEVERVPNSDYEGIIVTNLFGGAADISQWTDFARKLGKILIFDSAASFFSTYQGVPLGRFGNGEAFSFHHTKPCGVGEGGCVVVPSEHKNIVRSLINFGRFAGIDTGSLSMNGKLSDIAAVFIADRLRRITQIREVQRRQWRRITDVATALDYRLAGDPAPGVPSVAALLAPEALDEEDLVNDTVKLHKGYRPLSDAPRAWEFYRRLVCVPCHGEMASLPKQQIEMVLAGCLRSARDRSGRRIISAGGKVRASGDTQQRAVRNSRYSSSKVFCIGCNKTGTKSLKAAMEELGFTFGDQETAAQFAVEDWPRRDFARLEKYCRDSDAFQDAPFSYPFTYQAMDAAFPGSKFILTMRKSPDEWYSSLVRFHGKIFSKGNVPPTRADLEQASTWGHKGRPWQMNRLLFDSPEDEPYQKDRLIAFYKSHVWNVQAYFRHRPSDLLVLDVSKPDAFSRLSRFLGKPEVEKAFPHLNRT